MHYYDFLFFKVLIRAFIDNKKNLLKKFFLLRSKYEGKLTLRSNFQILLLLSLFNLKNRRANHSRKKNYTKSVLKSVLLNNYWFFL